MNSRVDFPYIVQDFHLHASVPFHTYAPTLLPVNPALCISEIPSVKGRKETKRQKQVHVYCHEAPAVEGQSLV